MESKLIVISHGAHSLRIGLASDSAPKIVPNYLARRIKKTDGVEVTVAKSPVKHVEDLNAVVTKLTALDTIQNTIKDTYKLYPLTANDPHTLPAKQATIYHQGNSIATETEPVKKKKKSNKALATAAAAAELDLSTMNLVIGEDAIQASRDPEWSVYQPMLSCASFNITPGHSLRSICDDLAAMWKIAIQKYLNIDPADLNNYGCVYTIPDHHTDRRELKEITGLLLKELPFTSALLYQESICSLFGAGLGTACLVDIGHRSIKIACIDDGYLVPSSRITLRYGGENITQLLGYLLRQGDAPLTTETPPTRSSKSKATRPLHKYYFPLPPVTVDTPYTTSQLEDIKNNNIHLRLNDENRIKHATLKEKETSSRSIVYSFNGDDVFKVCAMSMFHPNALAPLQKETVPLVDHEELNEDDVPSAFANAPVAKTSTKQLEGERNLTLPLDQAIHRSIQFSADRPEFRRKYYSNITLVGGGSSIPGLDVYLRKQVSILVNAASTTAAAVAASGTPAMATAPEETILAVQKHQRKFGSLVPIGVLVQVLVYFEIN
eukprot:gene385-452_t